MKRQRASVELVGLGLAMAVIVNGCVPPLPQPGDGGLPGDGGTPDGGSSHDGGSPHDGGALLDGGAPGDGGALSDGGSPRVCGASDGGASFDGGPFDPPSFARAYAPAFCDWEARCNAGPPEPACDTWALAGELNQDVLTLALAIDAGLQIFDPAAAQECLTKLVQCDCGFGYPAACRHLGIGQVPLGGTCYSKADCAAGSCGPANDFIPCPATCVPYAEAPGQDCSHTDCDPAQGLACAFVSETCVGVANVPTVGVGHACADPSSPARCADDLYCDTATGSTAVCAPFASTGEACSDTVPCASPLACVGDGGTNLCQTPSGVGDPCVPSVFREEGCLLGLACVAGSCQLAPSDGACGSDLRAECDVLHYCDANKKCLPIKDNGQPCTDRAGCWSLNCTSGFCVGPDNCHP